MSREGKHPRDLDFERTMHQTGLAWLPHELFNWSGSHLHNELVNQRPLLSMDCNVSFAIGRA